MSVLCREIGVSGVVGSFQSYLGFIPPSSVNFRFGVAGNGGFGCGLGDWVVPSLYSITMWIQGRAACGIFYDLSFHGSFIAKRVAARPCSTDDCGDKRG